MRNATVGERIARMYAWTGVALRYPIVVGWIAAVVLAVVFLPGLRGSSSTPLNDIVPPDAAAIRAQERALQLFGSTVATDAVVVERNPSGLEIDEVEAHVRAARAVAAARQTPRSAIRAAVPLVNVSVPGAEWREQGTTILTYLFLSPELNLLERDRTARRYSAALPPPPPGAERSVTGAGPARLQQFSEIERVLPIVTVATIGVILLIAAIYFRSVGAPLVTLATAGLAYAVAIRALAWTGDRVGVSIPSEIEPVLVVLLLGLVTDYTIFFMSETRRRLMRGEPRVPAARAAAARITPIVLTAGILVGAGALSLLAGKMEFFRVFGPGLAVSALVVTVVCVTLVPAILAIAGPRLFGRRVREAQAAPPKSAEGDVVPASPAVPPSREHWRLRFSGILGAVRASRRQARDEGGTVTGRLLSRMLATRPLALLLAGLCIAGLVLAATGARATHLAVSFIPSLPEDSDVRRAGDDAARGFVGGILSPTELVLERPGLGERRDALERLQTLMARQPGVAAVIGPATSPGGKVERVVVAEGGGAARYAVLLEDEPTGADAIATLRELRDRLPALQREAGLDGRSRVWLGGETALAVETIDALSDDLWRVAATTSVLTFLLLALFLQALVAPLLLLAGSVLAFAGSFGLTSLLLPDALGGTDFVYYVPLVGAVLLVGLGSDYNVFIAGRIREESRRRRLREAIAVGAPSASRAITAAGITLASTFALLAIVPLRPFRELALLMTLGVLIDALVVRPLLIPSLIALAGRAAWWPGRARRRASSDRFLGTVERRTGLDRRGARRVSAATLVTLAERIPAREVEEIAGYLPEGLAVELSDAVSGPEPFTCEEFVARVAERSGGTIGDARADARAVIATLVDALPQEEVDYIRATLSEDYRPLFGDDPSPREPALAR